jgi:hypothetical protein
VVIEGITAATISDDLQLQWRTGTGTTYSGATYYSAVRQVDYLGTLSTAVSSAATQFLMSPVTSCSLALYINGVGNASEVARWHGTQIDYANANTSFGGGMTTASLLVTGFILKSTSTNITGDVAVYGLAK